MFWTFLPFNSLCFVTQNSLKIGWGVQHSYENMHFIQLVLAFNFNICIILLTIHFARITYTSTTWDHNSYSHIQMSVPIQTSQWSIYDRCIPAVSSGQLSVNPIEIAFLKWIVHSLKLREYNIDLKQLFCASNTFIVWIRKLLPIGLYLIKFDGFCTITDHTIGISSKLQLL